MSKDNKMEKFASEAVSFIERAAPVLDKAARVDAAFSDKLPQVVDRMVEMGIIQGSMKQAKLQQFSDDPSSVCDLLLKVASRVAEPTTMGKAAEKVDLSTKPLSADEQFVQTMLGASRQI